MFDEIFDRSKTGSYKWDTTVPDGSEFEDDFDDFESDDDNE